MLALTLALLGMVTFSVVLLTYATTPLGPGVATDAVNYLSGAASLSHGNGYLGWDGQLEPYFPPGYSIAIALGVVLSGFGATQAAQLADVVLFAALVIATYLLASRLIATPALRLLFTALVASSPIVLQVYALVSSETLFNFLCVAALVVVYEVRRVNPLSPLRYPALGLLAAIAAIALMTRLMGVALVLSLAIALVVAGPPGKRLVERAVESLGFCVVAIVPITLWDSFIHSETGSWTFGDRPPGTVGIGDNLLTAANTLAGWPGRLSTIVPGGRWLDLVGAALAVLAVAMGVSQVVRRRSERLRKITPVLIFCVVYPALLIALSTRVAFVSALDDRYLSPLLAPLVILFGFLIDQVWMSAQRSGKLAKGAALAVTGAVALSLLSSAVASGRDALQEHERGVVGATTADWSRMSLLRAVRRLPTTDGGILLSNLPEMMSYSTGRQYQYPPSRTAGAPQDLRKQVSAIGPAYLVVISSFTDPENYTPEELGRWFSVRVLDSSSDGQLVELSDLQAAARN
ncbi:MAG TPA: hypothetical protein VN863_00925 [Candidatus Dormibacteraeota bacterium]|nr:hypothetical protein [Candidatus Dormibacteraeota bacterium]